MWYYILFGIICFLTGRARAVWLPLATLICGPNIILYMPLWLMGVLAYHFSSRSSLYKRPNGALAFLIYIASVLSYVIVAKHAGGVGHMYVFYGSSIEIRTVCYYSAIGIAIALNIIGFDMIAKRFGDLPRMITHIVRWAAGASFTLYLCHFPLLVLFAAAFPNSLHNQLLAALGCICVLLSIAALAEVGERRKRIFTRIFAPLTGSFLVSGTDRHLAEKL